MATLEINTPVSAPGFNKPPVVTRKGEIVTRERAEMDFGYRESSLTELVIVDATFRFEKEDPEKTDASHANALDCQTVQ